MSWKPIWILALIVIWLVAWLFAAAGLAIAQTPAPEPGAARAQEGEGPEPTATGLLDEVVMTRTPAPTSTPGIIAQQVDEFTAAVGLQRKKILGLAVADWINLGISVAAVLIGYLVGTWLIRLVLPPIVQRSPTAFDDELLQAIGPNLRWLVVVLVLSFSTQRLTFLNANLKSLLDDLYFVLSLAVVVRIIWRCIDLAYEWYRARLTQEDRLEQLDPLLTLLVRLGRVIVAVSGVTVLLSRLGVNVTAFAAALGLGGLAFSLAARDTIADAIAGFIILVDQPFRIGDRIEIQDVGTWGDVVDIGLRTTRIRTRDNRMVIVPNSIIGSNQVVNYTFPDARYRIETHVGVAYGTDIKRVQRIIINTVRQVEGVLQDKPVDALYNEMGDSSMIFRVRWWIESYEDTRRMYDRVHTALQEALDDAGIDMPFPTQSLKLQVGGGATGELSGSQQSEESTGRKD